MTLLEITPVADGAHATLRIQGESRDPLPAFSATVEYGQIQGTTENYQEVNAQSLLVNALPVCWRPVMSIFRYR